MAPDGSLIVNNWRLNRLARVAVAPDGKPGPMTVIQTSRPLEVPDGMRLIDGMRIAVAEGSGKVAIITIGRRQRAGADDRRGPLVGGRRHCRAGRPSWHVPGELSYVFNARGARRSRRSRSGWSPVPLP